MPKEKTTSALAYTVVVILCYCCCFDATPTYEQQQPPTSIACPNAVMGFPSSIITIHGNLTYVTTAFDGTVNMILCEKSANAGDTCIPVTCDVPAGSMCAIQSPNGRDFNTNTSLCVQDSQGSAFPKMVELYRKSYGNGNMADFCKAQQQQSSRNRDFVVDDYCSCHVPNRKMIVSNALAQFAIM